MRGRIRRRLALAIVLTALIPVCVAIWLSGSMLRQSTARFFLPEIGQRLGQSLELYRELASAVKARMRADAEAISRAPDLLAAVAERDGEALATALRAELARYRDVASLALHDETEQVLAQVDRGTPIDPERELSLHVTHPLPGALSLEAVF